MQLLEDSLFHQESLGAPEMLPKTRCEDPVISITLHFALGLWNLFYLEILRFLHLKSHSWCWWSEVPRQRNTMFC